ncbi:MAG: SH3 domain-containing protein [Anaerolineae bacterium]|nr:SH3 domain-containing protein [Anaerolineae bacterium]
MIRSQMKPLVFLLVLLLVLTGVSAVFAAGAVSATCPGSLESRLTVGDQGRVAREYSTLRNAPAGVPIAYKGYGSVFTVVGNAVCANNLLYVQIDYGSGLIGWANESQVSSEWGGNLYWLEPAASTTPVTPTPTAVPVTPVPTTPPPTTLPPCAASLPPLLAVGDGGMVAREYSTLRDAPAGNPVAIYPHGSRFEVLEGPICAGYGPLTWYKIRYTDGKEGWASESQRISIWGSNLYWLEKALEG